MGMLDYVSDRDAAIGVRKGCWMNCLTRMLGGVFQSHRCMACLTEMLSSIFDSEAELVFDRDT